MKKYKALYCAMYDDLKDADMLIDYAYCVREENEEDKELADSIAKYALERFNHFKSFHKLFQEEVAKEDVTQETAYECLWSETHEHMQEWAEEIEEKIKEY